MDKKRILALAFVSVLTGSAASAQTFDQLWRTTKEQREKDLPKSALKTLLPLKKKAQETGDVAQLVRVMLTEYGLQYDISPDSARVTLREMEQLCAAEQRPVARALWNMALAQLWQAMDEAVASEFFEKMSDVSPEISELLEKTSEGTTSNVGKDTADPLMTNEEDETTEADHRREQLVRAHLLAAFSDVPALAQASLTDYSALFKDIQKAGAYSDQRLLVVFLNDLFTLENNSAQLPMPLSQFLGILEQSRELFTKNGHLRAALQVEKIVLKARGHEYLEVMSQRASFSMEELDKAGERHLLFPSSEAVIKALKSVIQTYRSLPEVGEVAKWHCELLIQESEVALVDEDISEEAKAQSLALKKEALTLAERYEKEFPKLSHDFQNLIKEQMRPWFNVSWRGSGKSPIDRAFYPNSTMVMPVSFVNVKQVSVELYRLSGIDASQLEKATKKTEEEQKKLRQLLQKHGTKKPILSETHRLPSLPAYETGEDSLQITLPETGVYLMRLKADGWYDKLAPCYVSRGVRLLFSSASRKADKPEYLIVDQRSGEELLSSKEALALPVIASRPYWTQRHHDTLAVRSLRDAEIYTDREVYRPGQSVEASALLYTQHGDDYKVWAKAKVEARLLDSNRKEIAKKSLVADDFGVVSTSFSLPKYCRPGHFSVALAYGDEKQGRAVERSVKSFRVEEYKRPNFTVKLDAFSQKLQPTDSVAVKGVAQTFAGLPVTNAELRWRLDISGFGLLGKRGRTSVKTEVHESGTQKTDSAGRFVVPLSWKMDAKMFLYLQFAAEVVAPDGEVQSTNVSTWLSERPKDEDKQEKKPLLEVETNEAGDKATLKVNGSGRLFYRLVSTNRGVVQRKSLAVSEGFSLPLEWKASEHYGDALKAFVYMLQDGEFSTEVVTVTRPRPDKRLKVKWSTFRNALTPGQEEEWTLSVTHPDGSPAAANIVARLYDASLDAFLRMGSAGEYIGANSGNNGAERQNPWQFSYTFPRERPWGVWYAQSLSQPSFYGSRFMHYPQGFSYPTVSWRDDLFPSSYVPFNAIGSNVPMRIAVADYAMEEKAVSPAPLAASARMLKAEAAQQNGRVAGLPSEGAGNAVRSNFAETAFFRPTLRTDASGVATLRFTLPERLTEWSFDAFAFDRSLSSGTLSDKVVARKMLNAQVAAPRFLRVGDELAWPVSLYNMIRATQKGQLSLEILNAATQQVLKQFVQPFELADSANLVQHWKWRVPEGISRIVVRVKANSDAFSDGESHEISVLPRTMFLTVAQPFTVRQGEDATAEVEKAKKSLLARMGRGVKAEIAVAKSRSAIDEVADLVPKWLEVKEGSAYDQAVNLYGIEAAMTMSRKDSTWISRNEALAYRQTAFERLKALQNADGGWSWYPGMPTSPYITSQIAVLLARAAAYFSVVRDNSSNELVEDPYGFNAPLLRKAWTYLNDEMAHRIAEAKRLKLPTYLGETETNYLYLARLLHKEDNAAIRYWRDALGKKDVQLFTMYGKALQAELLRETKYDALSQTALQSVVEHTVVSPEMGRYFNTHRALGGWASYRIPTQVMTIEAIRNASSQALEKLAEPSHQLLGELYLWLLQSKRTQVWNNSRATTDAAFSVLRMPATSPLHQLSWGAVSATYEAKPEEVAAEGSGFALTRRLEVLRDGKWRAFSDGKSSSQRYTLRVGDHVRWAYTVKAERDFDHVRLSSARPAAFESKNPFSGTTWMGEEQAYRMVRDAENEYFFEHFSKGTHTFYDEMVVVREGDFSGGVATVQCTFSPEFVAHSNAAEIKVK